MIKKLLKELKKSENRIIIQTHDFPDPDAVASAYGLQYFFKQFNIQSEIVYNGEIQRDALKKMINLLNITITHARNFTVNPDDIIVIVDGCKGSKNVTSLNGKEIAVIDHHIVHEPDNVPFIEIKDNLGSCSTIITGYFMESEIDIPQNAATALKIGLSRDTDLLTRKVTETDVKAYNYLHKHADNDSVNSLLRNNIELADFKFFNQAITKLKRDKAIAWHYFEEGCETNLMGILGDFILSAQEIELSLLFACNGDSISISIRNENCEWSAADIIRSITKDIGAGGGHNEMAGGVIFRSKGFYPDEIMARVVKDLYS